MLPLTLTPDEVLGFASCWSKLLAAGDFQQACDLLDEPRDTGERWTPDLLRYSVEVDHFGPGTVFRAAHPEGVVYSDPSLVPPPREGRHSVIVLTNGRGYWLDWDLPLNGEWSDLTAQFEFTRSPQGYRVCLHDLHVM